MYIGFKTHPNQVLTFSKKTTLNLISHEFEFLNHALNLPDFIQKPLFQKSMFLDPCMVCSDFYHFASAYVCQYQSFVWLPTWHMDMQSLDICNMQIVKDYHYNRQTWPMYSNGVWTNHRCERPLHVLLQKDLFSWQVYECTLAWARNVHCTSIYVMQSSKMSRNSQILI